MKTSTIIAILIVSLLIEGYCYVNLDVSYKYEVDLAETNIIISSASQQKKIEQLRDIKLRSHEIYLHKRMVKIAFIASLAGLIFIPIMRCRYSGA